jgi:hypothetical protein
MITCDYCREPFTPTPGPMANKQRFCCTNHRIYWHRINRLVAQAPEFTDNQINRLRLILQSAER